MLHLLKGPDLRTHYREYREEQKAQHQALHVRTPFWGMPQGVTIWAAVSYRQLMSMQRGIGKRCQASLTTNEMKHMMK